MSFPYLRHMRQVSLCVSQCTPRRTAPDITAATSAGLASSSLLTERLVPSRSNRPRWGSPRRVDGEIGRGQVPLIRCSFKRNGGYDIRIKGEPESWLIKRFCSVWRLRRLALARGSNETWSLSQTLEQFQGNTIQGVSTETFYSTQHLTHMVRHYAAACLQDEPTTTP